MCSTKHPGKLLIGLYISPGEDDVLLSFGLEDGFWRSVIL